MAVLFVLLGVRNTHLVCLMAIRLVNCVFITALGGPKTSLTATIHFIDRCFGLAGACLVHSWNERRPSHRDNALFVCAAHGHYICEL